jgi:hypothetical protein
LKWSFQSEGAIGLEMRPIRLNLTDRKLLCNSATVMFLFLLSSFVTCLCQGGASGVSRRSGAACPAVCS